MSLRLLGNPNTVAVSLMGLWLCRRVDRGDGVDTTMLRKNPTADAGDDAWLDSEAEVETGETVEFIKKEVSLPKRDGNDRPMTLLNRRVLLSQGAFALVATKEGDEGWLRATYIHSMAATNRRSKRCAAGTLHCSLPVVGLQLTALSHPARGKR